MGEVEFDRLLDAVQVAMAPIPGEDVMLGYTRASTRRPQAANDNQLAWPLIPFPAGWNGSC